MAEMLEKLKAENPYKGRDISPQFPIRETCWQEGVEHCYTRMIAEGYRRVLSEREIEQQFWHCQNPNGTLSVSRLHQFMTEQE